MSQQYDNFLSELEQLMHKHNIAIFPSRYDGLQVWSANSLFQTKEKEIKESLNNFEDRTEANEN